MNTAADAASPPRARLMAGRTVPVLVVVLAILAVWYVAAIALNAPRQRDLGAAEAGPLAFIAGTMAQERPVLPAPHQMVAEFVNSVFLTAPDSRRSLLYHSWVTLSSTLAGFAFGALLGIVLAVGIVHQKSLDRSLMPWIVASQTIPVLAVAPMIVVVTYNWLTGSLDVPADISRFVAKALISTFLSFFPVTVGMTKGLRSPEPIHLDLLKTYNAGRGQVFRKLRWPASLPFLFVSLKIAVTAALIGAIVGEMPTGAVAGIGARLLGGSYYGQTVQIWAALLAASIMASALVAAVALAERLTLRRMGMAPA